jgi:hypothetical protein
VIRWKDTCRFDDINGAIVLAILRADALFAAAGVDCWITSLNDSTHMLGSKHFIGRAVDLRSHHLPEADRAEFHHKLRVALGPQFTVLYESPRKPNEHYHIQFNGV